MQPPPPSNLEVIKEIAQFSKVEPEVCIAKFSSVTQRSRVTTNLFIAINLVDPLHHKVAVGDPPSTLSFTSPLPVEKTHDLRKKSQARMKISVSTDISVLGFYGYIGYIGDI